MLSKITRLRRNRRYDYSPRYYDDKGKGSPYKLEPKFDQFRSTLSNQRGLKNKITNAVVTLYSALQGQSAIHSSTPAKKISDRPKMYSP